MSHDRAKLPSTAGYADEAPRLLERYEAYDPASIYRWLLPHLPEPPADAVDIGAGTGRDAGWLAGLGFRVVAVEPVPEMRQGAQRLHPEESIEWVDDLLPGLPMLENRRFDVILLGAVWMHLDPEERAAGMARLASLSRSGALLGMTVRHGPVPTGRRMFEIGDEEVVELASRNGFQRLDTIPATIGGRGSQKPDVSFSTFAFRRRPS